MFREQWEQAQIEDMQSTSDSAWLYYQAMRWAAEHNVHPADMEDQIEGRQPRNAAFWD
jgi:hypothetical protein